jgi:hypothetical protein
MVIVDLACFVQAAIASNKIMDLLKATFFGDPR